MRSFVAIVVTWAFFVVLLCRNGKTFRERTFALHRQQPDKHQQNVDVAPLEKFLRTPVLQSATPVTEYRASVHTQPLHACIRILRNQGAGNDR